MGKDRCVLSRILSDLDQSAWVLTPDMMRRRYAAPEDYVAATTLECGMDWRSAKRLQRVPRGEPVRP